jgi:hypothetical protein
VESWYFAGVDLGQRRDPAAIAVVERAELAGEWDAVQFAYRKVVEYRVRHLERFRLGTAYPVVVERVKQVTEAGALAGRVTAVVDATGPGTPVVDMLRGAGLRCQLVPVMITPGAKWRRDGGYYMVPKRDLVMGLLLRLEQGELKIAGDLAEGERLAREMAQMRVRVGVSGREQYGTWRKGEHDDLVVAVALGCWGGWLCYRGAGAGWVARDGVRGWEREVRGAVGRLV